jgi:tricorn protease
MDSRARACSGIAQVRTPIVAGQTPPGIAKPAHWPYRQGIRAENESDEVSMPSRSRSFAVALLILLPQSLAAQSTRLLRQPSLGPDAIAFAHAGDLWSVGLNGGEARRLTATPAVESDPHLSPDGRWLAFTSTRSGVPAVYVMPAGGGEPTRLTWYPSPSYVRGWTPDGERILYATTRGTAPVPHERLWTVAREGGPSVAVPAPWGTRGSYSPDGRRMALDPMDRWDVEWRNYRGGQNTPLVILDLNTLDEVLLPNDERTTDIGPVWLGGTIYFLSDRDRAMNVWAYDVATRDLRQITRFTNADVKSLAGRGSALVLEQDGYIHVLDSATGQTRRLDVTVRGDFPWASARWVDASRSIATAALSPTGMRALMEARGEVFTIPVDKGDSRNLTRSAGAADRAPVWSPDGARVAWFSDDGSGYRLKIGSQDGLGAVRTLPIGDSKYAWNSTWSPDGARIAFVDDRARVRIVDVESGSVSTADTDGDTNARNGMGLVWSNDSQWLAYSKSFPNHLRRIVVWSANTRQSRPVTDPLADARSPAFDRDGRHLYFLASTDLALASGWANTSSMQAQPTYAPYVMVLRAEDPTPFTLESDEEPAGVTPPRPDTASTPVRIDFDGIENRIIPLPMPVRSYTALVAGPRGSVFIGESVQNTPGLTLHKFTLADRKTEAFARGVTRVSASADGKKLLYQSGGNWQVVDATRASADANTGRLNVALRAHIDPAVEWQQIFDEAWRYQRDFFYDPGTHGADWDAVRRRYEPLLPHVRHRTDLNYVLDMVNGELSVGHSFVGGGDLPPTDTVRVGLPGADLEAHEGRWRIRRIYTAESWNPGLTAPLAAPGLQVRVGQYILAVDGIEMTAADDPYRLFDGTLDRQTVLHINDRPTMAGARTVTIRPVGNENTLRQRAWVEDNRRRVDELSNGRLAYVWVPNTGGPGVVSFNRYYFAQQDRQGAVIDERYNGGGLLDDYMVDLMNRTLRAAITNEAPGGQPFQLPAGVLGPKVLLINELAGSGGDYFPWVFRHQRIGPLIGKRTWGGLVRSCSHYPMVDGGFITSPCNAVFQPGVGWIAENEGVPPDIEVRLDAKSFAAGRDPQLERGVQEALRLLEAAGERRVTTPPFPRPAGWPR